MSPAMAKAVDRLEESQTKGLAALRQRLEAEWARRNSDATRRLENLDTALRPLGRPQERVLSALSPLLVQYGEQALDRIAEELDPGIWEIQIIRLASP